MTTQIVQLTLGVCNCYLIKQKGLILVDTGSIPNSKAFIQQTEKAHINPSDLSLILLTHGHWDHIAGTKEIKETTGAKTAINFREAPWMRKANPPLPPPTTLWGRIFGSILKIMVPMVKLKGVKADIEMSDGVLTLEPYGINGKVMHTPGHSKGSMSVILNSGEAFVGDLAMNGFPMRVGPGLPIFADSEDQVRASWTALLENGAKTIYPAHGNPFPASELKKQLQL